jgi:phosphopentomutase
MMMAIAITLFKTKNLIQKNMKATLIFNLDDYDDSFAHRRCIKAYDMALALNQIEMDLRNHIKKSDDGKTIDGLLFQNRIKEVLDCYVINLNILIE